jgi:hypothetical protein
MRKENDVLEFFNILVALVERKSGRKVKALRSNNGGEYCSNEFKFFCNLMVLQGRIPHHIS